MRAKGTADGFHAGLYASYTFSDEFSVTVHADLSRFDTETEPRSLDYLGRGDFDQRVISTGMGTAYD